MDFVRLLLGANVAPVIVGSDGSAQLSAAIHSWKSIQPHSKHITHSYLELHSFHKIENHATVTTTGHISPFNGDDEAVNAKLLLQRYKALLYGNLIV